MSASRAPCIHLRVSRIASRDWPRSRGGGVLSRQTYRTVLVRGTTQGRHPCSSTRGSGSRGRGHRWSHHLHHLGHGHRDGLGQRASVNDNAGNTRETSLWQISHPAMWRGDTINDKWTNMAKYVSIRVDMSASTRQKLHVASLPNANVSSRIH